MAAASSTSKMLLPEAFTGSNDLESYITHFELLAELQNWKRTEGTPAREVDERPHYFALRLQKAAIEFYRTLPQATRENYDQCVKAFREHYSEKPVVFRGRLARRVQQPGEKLTDFLGDLKQLALKAYPDESDDIRNHLVLRGFLEGIHHSQVRLDLRKQIGEKDMKIETVLERALHLEAVTKIEEEEQQPKIAAIRRDENRELVEAVTKLISQMTTDDGNRNQRASFSRERSNSRGRWESRNRDRDSYRKRDGSGRRRHPTPGPGQRDYSNGRRDSSRDSDRRKPIRCRACGQEGHPAKYCKNCFFCGSSQHLKKDCPQRKKKDEKFNLIKICSANAYKCFNTELIIHGHKCIGLVDSGSSVSLISQGTYERLGKPGKLEAYNKRVLAANNSSVQIMGKVNLFVQFKPKTQEIEQEFLVTAEECIECIIGIDFLVRTKCVLNIADKQMYSNRLQLSVPLTTDKYEVTQTFAVSTKNEIVPSKHEALINIHLRDGNNEETPGKEGFVEGIEGFQDRTGLIVASCMVSPKQGQALIKVLNLTDEQVVVYKDSKLGTYQENNNCQKVNGICSSKEKPKHPEPFRMGKHASLEGSQLSKDQQFKVKEMFERHNKVFSRNSNDLGYCDKIQHKIILTANAQPFRRAYGSMSFDKRKAMKKIVEDLEKSNLVEPTHSYWAAPSILVKKKDGSYRLVVDYRGLNKQIEKTSWPLPRINDVIDSLDGNYFFSNIDLTSGYFQMALHEESQDLTAFITPMGLYKWKRLPMGLASAPGAFQNLMELIMAGLSYEVALVYLDDIIIFGRSFEEHLDRLDLVLGRLKEAGLKIKGSKCRFFQEKIHFLGHIVSRKGVEVDPEKVSAVEKMKSPTTIKELRAVLGLVGFYRRFIQDFGGTAEPLYKL